MSKLFLRPQYLKILTDIFESYCPEAEIWAYGSRVKGEAHDSSDLDMVVRSFNSNKNIYKLRELINDSNIPILTDILEFEKLPKTFQEEIEKEYVIIYKPKNQ